MTRPMAPVAERYMRRTLLGVMDHLRKLTLTAPLHFTDEDYRHVDRQLCGAGAHLATMLAEMQGEPEYYDWINNYSSDISTFGELRAATARGFLDQVNADMRRVAQKTKVEHECVSVLFGKKPRALAEDQWQQDNDPSWFRHGLARETLFDARDQLSYFQTTPATHPATSQAAGNDSNPTHPPTQDQNEEDFRAHISSIDFHTGPPDDEMFAHPTPTEPQGPVPQLEQPVQSAPTNDSERVEYFALIDRIIETIRVFVDLLKTYESDQRIHHARPEWLSPDADL